MSTKSNYWHYQIETVFSVKGDTKELAVPLAGWPEGERLCCLGVRVTWELTQLSGGGDASLPVPPACWARLRAECPQQAPAICLLLVSENLREAGASAGCTGCSASSLAVDTVRFMSKCQMSVFW